VVQVYVEDVESTVARPVRELKGFTKVVLAAGKSETVSVELDQRSFSFWSTRLGRWAVEAGTVVIGVGSSSRKPPADRDRHRRGAEARQATDPGLHAGGVAGRSRRQAAHRA
jgi:beta-glucosidase